MQLVCSIIAAVIDEPPKAREGEGASSIGASSVELLFRWMQLVCSMVAAVIDGPLKEREGEGALSVEASSLYELKHDPEQRD